MKFSSVCYDFEGREALTHANYFSFRGDYPFPKFASSAHFTKTNNLLVYSGHETPQNAYKCYILGGFRDSVGEKVNKHINKCFFRVS